MLQCTLLASARLGRYRFRNKRITLKTTLTMTASYRLVRSSLTKAAQAELDPFESAAPPHSPSTSSERPPSM